MDPGLGVMAITVELKEGIKEGGRAVGWVVAEVVRASGCARYRHCPSSWSHRHRRIGGASSQAERHVGVERRRGGGPSRWSAAPPGGGLTVAGWRAAEWSATGWMEQERLLASVSILGVLVIGRPDGEEVEADPTVRG
jgi:hypothetical protein